MKKMALISAGVGTAAALLALSVARSSSADGGGDPVLHSALPSPMLAKAILNTTHRHREWISVPVGSATVRAFVVYPERADKAPLIVLDEKTQGASDWVRAVGDQLAAEGYLVVVPDVLSGLGPRGGDGDSFATPAAVAQALQQLGPAEIARRRQAVAAYVASLPPANGKVVDLEVSPSPQGARLAVSMSDQQASFDTPTAWRRSIAFLNRTTDNRPVAGTNPDLPEDHSAHMMMAQAAPPAAPAAGPPAGPGRLPPGYPFGKLPELPAGLFSAKSTLLHSTLKKEWVDIPVGNVKLHTWVEYPAGDGKAPVVLVMQQLPGLDDWQRAIADQLALQGFIAVAPDLFSGLGPNGGNYDSFEGTDAVMRAGARLSRDEVIRRYKAAYAWGMALPRASGKVATLGFCAGGGTSFEFAGEVPAINAAVVFYGGAPKEELMAKIQAPVIGFYGENDERVTATAAPAAEKMKALGKSFEYHVYPRATHAFIMFQDMGQNGPATADSWPRAIEFLNRHLK